MDAHALGAPRGAEGAGTRTEFATLDQERRRDSPPRMRALSGFAPRAPVALSDWGGFGFRRDPRAAGGQQLHGDTPRRTWRAGGRMGNFKLMRPLAITALLALFLLPASGEEKKPAQAFVVYHVLAEEAKEASLPK